MPNEQSAVQRLKTRVRSLHGELADYVPRAELETLRGSLETKIGDLEAKPGESVPKESEAEGTHGLLCACNEGKRQSTSTDNRLDLKRSFQKDLASCPTCIVHFYRIPLLLVAVIAFDLIFADKT